MYMANEKTSIQDNLVKFDESGYMSPNFSLFPYSKLSEKNLHLSWGSQEQSPLSPWLPVRGLSFWEEQVSISHPAPATCC